MLELDNIDRQLISILRTNVRTSISDLAKKINVSRATIQNRLTKLDKRNVITGYTILVSTETDDKMALVRAHMNIEIKGSSTKNVKFALMSEPSVCTIHTTNGRWDMIIEIQTSSLEEFDRILCRIRGIPEISASETSILLSSYQVRT